MKKQIPYAKKAVQNCSTLNEQVQKGHKKYASGSLIVLLVYRFHRWASSFPLLSRVYTQAEDDSPQKRTAIR